MADKRSLWDDDQYYYCGTCRDITEHRLTGKNFQYECSECKCQRRINSCVTDAKMGMTQTEEQKAQSATWRARAKRGAM